MQKSKTVGRVRRSSDEGRNILDHKPLMMRSTVVLRVVWEHDASEEVEDSLGRNSFGVFNQTLLGFLLLFGGGLIISKGPTNFGSNLT
jgi:hypothetical protein